MPIEILFISSMILAVLTIINWLEILSKSFDAHWPTTIICTTLLALILSWMAIGHNKAMNSAEIRESKVSIVHRNAFIDIDGNVINISQYFKRNFVDGERIRYKMRSRLGHGVYFSTTHLTLLEEE